MVMVDFTIPREQFVLQIDAEILTGDEMFCVDVSPENPCNMTTGCMNASTGQFVCEGWTDDIGEMYTFNVSTTNCGNQMGESSDVNVNLEGEA